jgi:hypothetical protein
MKYVFHINPVLNMRKVRQRTMKIIAQDDTAIKGQNQE